MPRECRRKRVYVYSSWGLRFRFLIPRSLLNQITASLFVHRAQTLPSLIPYHFTPRSLTTESLWLSGRALERGIQRSGVRFFAYFFIFYFFIPRSWQDEIIFLLLTPAYTSTWLNVTLFLFARQSLLGRFMAEVLTFYSTLYKMRLK